MTPDQFERLQQQLAALEPEIKNMVGASPGFVRDQIERMNNYGINIRVSVKQQKWLDDLYQEYVGELDALPGGDGRDLGAERGEVLGDDFNDKDDEIPF